MAIFSLPDKALKLLRLTTSGAKLADKIEDAVDPQIARNAIAAARRYLLGKPSQAAQRKAREQGESLRSAVGAKPRVKAPTPTVPVSRSSKPTTSRAGQAQNLANAQARSGISAAARQAARNATKPKGKKVTSSRTQGKGAPRSTRTSAAKKRASTPAKPGQESRAQGQQNLANAQAQSMISTAARRANPTGAARPQVRAGGGAGGKPPSRVAVGAGLGLVGGGIGAAALVAKKRAEQKEKEKAKRKNKPKSKFNPEGIKKMLASRAKKSADTATFRKASAASVGKPIPTPRAKPKPPPRKARLASSAGVPFKKLKANVPDNNLKTNLSAARKAGHLYYKNTKGDKMAAVSVADLKKSGFKDLQAFMNYQTNQTSKET